MCVPADQIVPKADETEAGLEISEAGLPISRRTAFVGAACLALSATIPGSASAAGSARSKVSSAAGSTGPFQSPIDFRRSEITFVNRLPTIKFGYPRKVDVTLINTKNPPVVLDEFATIRANVPASAGAHIVVSGMRWDLAQFHWHTPSEHEIEGRDTPLEMHFVHTPASPSAPALFLVLAVFMERGDKNRALEPIFRELPEEPQATREVEGVRLRALLPDERESFRYQGSLTTPNFDEPVLFIVFAESIDVSRRQIAAFREVIEEGNSREVQPLNDRQVLSDAEDGFDDEDDDD
jgi:carbonic anhydrase